MKRRKFLIASGSAILGFNASLQRSAMALKFNVEGVKNTNPSSVNKILVRFRNFELMPQYVESDSASVTIELDVDGYEVVSNQSSVSISNGQLVTSDDLGDAVPITLEGVDEDTSIISGDVRVKVDTANISDSYTQDFSISDITVRKDLVGWWKLNETTGDTAFDSSGNGVDASIVNAGPEGAGFATDSPLYDSAYKFGSSTDYVEIPSNTILQPSQGPRFSISCWVKHDLDSSHYYVSRAGDTNNKDYATFRFEGSTNKFEGSMLADAVSSNYSVSVDSKTSPSANQWYHVVFTKDWDGTESTLKIYVNGEFENSTTDSNRLDGQSDSASELRIGTNGYESAPIEGAMSDVRIYDRSISESEVSDLYSLGL